MNIANWLYATSLIKADAPALYCGTSLVANYNQFASRAYALSEELKNHHNISKGDRVAFYLPNCTEYLILFYAVWWLGAIAVPINYKLHKKEVSWILENSQSSMVYTDTGHIFESGELPDQCKELGTGSRFFKEQSISNIVAPLKVSSDDVAWLFYTSGTTGRPKGVMLTHSNLVAMSMCYPIDVDPIDQNDAALYSAPMSHGAGLYNMIFVRVGGAHVVPESRGFDSNEIFEIASKIGQISMFAAPTMVKRMVSKAKETGFKGTGIKTIVLGGGPMYAADLIEAIDVMGPKFAQIYGQGETPMTISAITRSMVNDRNNPRWHEHLASVGIAHSCIDIRIVDENLKDLAADNPGEILVKGPTVMKGYWKNEKATKETIVDGWLRTGDVGYLSNDGFLTLTDRFKDVIITGGTNVYPREVEETLLQHPDIYEAAVVGAPNKEWGEEVVAFIVVNDGREIDIDTLDKWCKSHMASFKKPKRYIHVQQLPKNNYGKVLKTELRKQV